MSKYILKYKPYSKRTFNKSNNNWRINFLAKLKRKKILGIELYESYAIAEDHSTAKPKSNSFRNVFIVLVADLYLECYYY